jgi:hypothetical protein
LTGTDLLVLVPWLFFGAGLAAIGYGLLSGRRGPRRRASGRSALSRHTLWRRGNRRLLARWVSGRAFPSDTRTGEIPRQPGRRLAADLISEQGTSKFLSCIRI